MATANRAATLRGWLPATLLAAWAAVGVALALVGRANGWPVGGYLLAGSAWVLVLLVAARDEVRLLFGPVFAYEIVRLGRRRLTFVMRFLYVLAVMAVLGILNLSWLEDVGYFRGGGVVPHHRLNEFASVFFYTFIVLQFVVVAVLTPAYVAGTVADEKERKTLEFLLATDLRNREIVFGKLAARVTSLLMYVLAGLPVVAFMQLFGGIDPDLLLGATAATVVTVVGFSAVGVFFSVRMRRPRDAIAMTYLALVVYLTASGFLGIYLFATNMWLARNPGQTWELFGVPFDPVPLMDVLTQGSSWLAAGNVFYHFVTLVVPGGGGLGGAAVVDALTAYVLFWGLVTAVLVAYSVRRLRAIALHQSYGAPKGDSGGGKKGVRAARSKPRVGDDPMVWKEVFAEPGMRGGCVGWVLFGIIVALIFFPVVLIAWFTLIEPATYGITVGLGRRWEDFAEGMSVWVRIVTGVIGFLAMIAAAVRGASAVSGEKDRDTWVSLLSTPLSAWEILRGKWLGAVLGVRRLGGLLAVVWSVGLVSGGANVFTLGLTAAVLAVFVSGFAWVGLYCSITARNTLIATVRALMAALFLAGGFWVFVGFCCAVPMAVAGADGDWAEDAGTVLLGTTPPFVVGWLPINEFDNDYDLEPFRWDDGPGPVAPALGVMVWVALNGVLGYLSYESLARQTNRARDRLSLPRPRPRTGTDRGRG